MNILKIFQYLVLIFNLAKPSLSNYCEYNNNTYNLECISTNNNEQINLNQEIIKINNLKLKGSNSIELLINLLFNNSKIESINMILL
jgi:hypothetical protein